MSENEPSSEQTGELRPDVGPYISMNTVGGRRSSTMEGLQYREGTASYLMRQILDCDGADFSKVEPLDGEVKGVPASERQGSKVSNEFSSEYHESMTELLSWGILPSKARDFEQVAYGGAGILGRICSARLCLQRLGLCLLAAAALGAFLFRLWQLVLAILQDCDEDNDHTVHAMIFIYVLDFIISLGALISLPLLSQISKCSMEPYVECLLRGQVQRRMLIKKATVASKYRVCIHILMWILAAVVRVLTEWYLLHDLNQHHQRSSGAYGHARVLSPRVLSKHAIEKEGVVHEPWVHGVIHLLSSGIVVVTMYCLSHICSMMVTMADAFCFRCSDLNLGINDLMNDWNMTQARFRRVAGYCENSIAVLMLTILSSFILSLAGPMLVQEKTMLDFAPLVNLGPLAALAALVFAKVADVTEKCRRVASLVNCISTGYNHQQRFFLVNYISESLAGFYMWEVPITGSMFLKASHLVAIAIFALASQLLGK